MRRLKKKRRKRRTGIRPLVFYSNHSFSRSAIATIMALGTLVILPTASLGFQVQPPVVGQNTGTTRSIQGTVLNNSGFPISGAVVLLKDTKTLQVRSYIAQSDGKYQFYGLSTDINYQLRAEAQGLTSKTKTVSVFDSHKVVKLDLKISKKLKQ